MTILAYPTLTAGPGWAEVAHQPDGRVVIRAEESPRDPRGRIRMSDHQAHLLELLLCSAARMAGTPFGADGHPVWCDQRDHTLGLDSHTTDLGIVASGHRYVLVGLVADPDPQVWVCVGYAPAGDGAWLYLAPDAALALAGMVAGREVAS